MFLNFKGELQVKVIFFFDVCTSTHFSLPVRISFGLIQTNLCVAMNAAFLDSDRMHRVGVYYLVIQSYTALEVFCRLVASDDS